MSERYKFNTYKEALDAVKHRGHSLGHVRPDLQTPELALMAVKKMGSNLAYIPAYYQTEEVIEAALKDNPHAKRFIKTKGLIMSALEEVLSE